jgi:hypothetical protein
MWGAELHKSPRRKEKISAGQERFKRDRITSLELAKSGIIG